MKVRDLVKFLMDFNIDAEVCISTGNTFDDWKDLSLSWGNPDACDGDTKRDAKYIYVNDWELENLGIEE